VTLQILDPIDPRVVDYDSRRLRDLVRAVMTDELARMRGDLQRRPTAGSASAQP
jgi:hypothetical protein